MQPIQRLLKLDFWSFSRVALDRAAVLLTMNREIVRLDNVWGVGGGQRPVKHLIKEVSSHQTGGDTGYMLACRDSVPHL